MKNFKDMSFGAFGNNAELVTKLFSKSFEGVEFKTEQEFLIKLSYKFDKWLSILDEECIPGNICGGFWMKRKLQLRGNKKDKNYILFLGKIFSEIPIPLLEKNILTEKEEEILISAYTDSYLEYRNAEEVDDSYFEKYEKSMKEEM